MRLWPLAIFAAACLATAGCRVHPAVALLEQENRDLEAQIYEVADLVEDCRWENTRLRQQIEDCRRENASLRRQLEGGQEGWDEPQASDGPRRSPEPIPTPEHEVPDFPDVPRGVESPAVELPSTAMSGEDFLEKFAPQGTLTAPGALPALTEPASESAILPRAANTQVAAITLDDRLTGGYNQDGRAGHEGIVVVIEPRDAEGRLVVAAAPVSVVVLDPALPGESARLARWDFTAAEVADRVSRTAGYEGIRLEMVWPGALPIHGRLHLFVRYQTDDGRKLEADMPVQIEIPDLEARRPAAPPLAGPASGPSEPAAGWQRRAPPADEPPAAERPQTASPAGRLPAWSPDRP